MDFTKAWDDFAAGLEGRLRAVRALAWPARAAIVAGTVAALLLYETTFWDSVIVWSKTVAPPTTSEGVSEIVRNLGLLVAGIFGLWLAFARTRVAQQGHITDRFSKAVEQLGHDNLAVRIGGLYALKRIAEDSPERDHLAIMDVIATYIRYPPYGEPQRALAEQVEGALQLFIDTGGGSVDPSEETPPPELIDCPDVVAAIEIVQRKTARQKKVELKRGYAVSLRGANLRYLRLDSVDLSGLDFRFADFTGANLTGANFGYANLEAALFRGANLTIARFKRADLSFANLTDANLKRASIVNTDLMFAHLTNTNFTGATLTGTDLRGADLTGADLTAVHGLTKGQLKRAHITGVPPKLPDGLTPPLQIFPED